MTLRDLCEALGLTVFTEGEPAREIEGCYIGDLLSWVMGRAPANCVWITVMQNVNVAAVALLADVGCVILAEGVTPDDALRARAGEKGVALCGSPRDAYALACSLKDLL